MAMVVVHLVLQAQECRFCKPKKCSKIVFQIPGENKND